MTVAYFAPIPFDFLVQRPQCLARELSKWHDVYYIEPTISLMRRVLKGGEPLAGKRQDVSDSLHIIKLNGFFTAHRVFDIFDPLRINTVWERLQMKKAMPPPDIVWVGYCGWYPVISGFPRIIYDRMDDNALLVRHLLMRGQLARYDKKLIEKAGHVFSTAVRLHEESLLLNRQSHLVPNAVDSSFAQNSGSVSSISKDRKVFGYVGMISDWFDNEAILRIAEADEKHEVVLVGPNHIKKIRHPRVKYKGYIPKEALPGTINDFDVCLYPFRQSRLLDTINPVKIYEYLSLNKPVLAIDSKELQSFGKLVVRYKTHNELEMLSKEHFSRPFETEKAHENFINENCWEQRGIAIQNILGGKA